MIVTIDGPAGSGKSTVARRLATRLGFLYLDTGAMYRVVAWKCLEGGIDPSGQSDVVGCVRDVEISFAGERVDADGIDVTDAIRAFDVTQAASVIALNAEVRSVLAELQRSLARGQNMVSEGRDQGTVVFADALCKFFLTADVEERARRRQHELKTAGVQITLEEMVKQLHERDKRDRNRAVAPLKAAHDAVCIDTTGMTIEAVLEQLEGIVKTKQRND